ncbi:MAG: rRNA pseudouridine synthase [Anaerolineales bacterium]|nr:rRNA pseudouridine synthase [Anaerolineales bacterium]
MQERLQKLMAHAGLGSRRENEGVIAAGRVQVNGRIAKLGDKADPATDQIMVDGRPLHLANEKNLYIILNKPRGVISSLEDEMGQGRKTVRDLIPVEGHIYPVGRLDKPSEGLILMTNDGKLAHRLTHPRYEHEKLYHVTLEGRLPDWAIDQWRRGINLDGKLTAAAPIDLLERSEKMTRMRIILREGRKRQIRRIAAAFGHPVRHLRRERIGPISIGNLKPGEWRHLSKEEVADLQTAVQNQR